LPVQIRPVLSGALSARHSKLTGRLVLIARCNTDPLTE